MTEFEAKERWCPMVFGRNTPAFNRDACFDHGGTHCIGSACMMWRPKYPGGAPWVQDPDRMTNERREEYAAELAIANTEGSCGLAGKP